MINILKDLLELDNTEILLHFTDGQRFLITETTSLDFDDHLRVLSFNLENTYFTFTYNALIGVSTQEIPT